MANSRGPVKRSGDLHPPEVESDPGLDTRGGSDEAPSFAPAVPAALQPPARVARARRVARIVAMPEGTGRRAGNVRATFEAARTQVRARPWGAVIAALALGLVLARVFR